jgi:hypothetical protein
MNSFEVFLLSFLLVTQARALERLEPADGCYVGMHLPEGETLFGLTSRLGFTPSVYSKFFDLPISQGNEVKLNILLDEVSRLHGIALLTIEPAVGLDVVTQHDCQRLATICATYEKQGIGGILIRFGHEMNGNWYNWGQQPILYKRTFRLLADSIHTATTRTAMMWAPNFGLGYPFGEPRPKPGSDEFRALDTDRDGLLSDHDDMFEPYYPGDDAVDWVGLTVYHWGQPYLENGPPTPMTFAQSLTGTYGSITPNFYARYCDSPARKKPLAIPETAAFYDTEQDGADELDIKQTWWRQLFNIAGDSSEQWDISKHFPKLKCINWFDEYKKEGVIQGHWIDWRVSVNPAIRSAFVKDLRALHNGRSYFLEANDLLREDALYCISAYNLPSVVPLAGDITTSLSVKTATDCDLVVDLLDETFHWQGGGRVPVSASGQIARVRFPLVAPLDPSKNYRWSIFLAPTGRDYLSAICWYNGPDPLVSAADLDNDGAPNGDEFIAGTSPSDPTELLSVDIQRNASDVILQWDSRIGRTYQLYATADFKIWIPASDLMIGTGQLIQTTLPIPIWNLLMIFRIRVRDR